MEATKDPLSLLTLLAFFSLASCIATYLVRKALVRHGVYDMPNDRSSHAVPKPRGGGLAVMGVILTGWIGYGLSAISPLPGLWEIMAGVLLLIAVSWLDDLRNLPARVRFSVQVLAVVLGFWGLERGGISPLLFQGWLPLWLDHLLLGIAWLWLINLYNFMDGIDGISGVETATIAVGLALLGLLFNWQAGSYILPLMLLGATLGFLVWNWEPSAIFLGDSGSIPLGYIFGWFFLTLIAQGYWAAAFILPLYYLGDATFTLLKRLMERKKVWQAHREHCYQVAVQNGSSHRSVALKILLCNLLLLALAVFASPQAPWLSLAGALLVVAATMLHLRRKSRQPA